MQYRFAQAVYKSEISAMNLNIMKLENFFTKTYVLTLEYSPHI
jgi:hypothetical protein